MSFFDYLSKTFFLAKFHVWATSDFLSDWVFIYLKTKIGRIVEELPPRFCPFLTIFEVFSKISLNKKTQMCPDTILQPCISPKTISFYNFPKKCTLINRSEFLQHWFIKRTIFFGVQISENSWDQNFQSCKKVHTVSFSTLFESQILIWKGTDSLKFSEINKTNNILSHTIYKIGENSFSQRERFSYPIVSIAFTFDHVFHQRVAHLPFNATELVRFFKTLKIWIFWENMIFFQKKRFFFKIAEGAKIPVECVSNGNFCYRSLSALIMRF